MKILVTVKRTPHRDVKMEVASDGALITADIKFEINPFDEHALEAALRIKEARTAEVLAATIGGAEYQEQLLTALAMGCDRAIRVDTNLALDSLQMARCLAALVTNERPDIVLAGKLAVDDENGQIPAMLAELLGWPQASQASKIELVDDGKRARITCEVDAGLEEVEVELPAVVTADLRLNEPRYASLPGIMKARKKPMNVLALAQLGEFGTARARVTGYQSLPPKSKGVMLGSAEALVNTWRDRQLI
ncbi:MAG: hypothetical protein A2W31_10050 [Planctomycetes bacterium RBG_16_64_10]|nr:MAG: hypothetical protein A2W31_10050 [Planctomycetes bacterium RBG_16_64_10]